MLFVHLILIKLKSYDKDAAILFFICVIGAVVLITVGVVVVVVVRLI